jgi:hypothetical protein
MKRIFIFPVLILLILVACVKTEQVSPIPEIKFISLKVYLGYDSLLEQYLTVGELKFSFIDGDADIGIYPNNVDTVAWNVNNYNVFLIPYEKVDTSYVAIDLDHSNPPPYYTIWHDDKLDRVGQNKTIKGTITITILDLPQYDTIRYEFYIRDRAGHDSNTETTTDIGTHLDMPTP